MSKISDEIREMFKKADDIRDAGLSTPENVVRYDDIQYGNDPKWNVLDVYRPKGTDGKKLPIIVSVHGGGWVYGDKQRYQYYCMSLVQHGFAVVNFTYRLSPEFKFPAAIEDANSVFAWLLDNADKYAFDTNNIFAVGDSAGAHQLGLFAAICTNSEYAAEYDFKVPKGLKLNAIILNCGAYKIEISENKEEMTTALMADYLPEGGSEKELHLINVIEHITPNYPPTFFMTCTGDFLLKDNFAMQKKLLECSIPHVFRFYGDANHQLGHVFHLNMKSEIAAQCNQEECEFLKRHII